MKIYGLLISTVMVLCAGLLGGWLLHEHFYPQQKGIEITRDIDRPVYKTIYVPKNADEWDAWSKTPIVIYREIDDKNILRIRATDGYKESSVTDKLNVGSAGNWKLTVAIGAGCLVSGAAAAYVISRRH